MLIRGSIQPGRVYLIEHSRIIESLTSIVQARCGIREAIKAGSARG